MSTDSIADLLTRIRNGMKAHKATIDAPYSKIKAAILKTMKESEFIEDFKEEQDGKFKKLVVVLKQFNHNLTLKRISKPGQRIYKKYTELKPVQEHLGLAILSTSKGIMTNVEAKKQKVGGEVLCEIY